MKKELLASFIVLSLGLVGCGGGGGGGSSKPTNPAGTGTEKPAKPDTTEPDTTEPDTTEPDTTEPDTTEPDTTEPDTTEPDTTEPDIKPDVANELCRTSDLESSDEFKQYLNGVLQTNGFDSTYGDAPKANTAGTFCIDKKLSDGNDLVMTVNANESIIIKLPDYSNRMRPETVGSLQPNGNYAVAALLAYVHKHRLKGKYIADVLSEKKAFMWEKLENLKKLKEDCSSGSVDNCDEKIKASDDAYVKAIADYVKAQKAFNQYERLLYAGNDNKLSNSLRECLVSELYYVDEAGNETKAADDNPGKNLYDISITPAAAGTFTLLFKLKANLKKESCYFSKHYKEDAVKSYVGLVPEDGYISQSEGTPTYVIESPGKIVAKSIKFDDVKKTIIVK